MHVVKNLNLSEHEVFSSLGFMRVWRPVCAGVVIRFGDRAHQRERKAGLFWEGKYSGL